MRKSRRPAIDGEKCWKRWSWAGQRNSAAQIYFGIRIAGVDVTTGPATRANGRWNVPKRPSGLEHPKGEHRKRGPDDGHLEWNEDVPERVKSPRERSRCKRC